jgi:hypothetical protein
MTLWRKLYFINTHRSKTDWAQLSKQWDEVAEQHKHLGSSQVTHKTRHQLQ